MTISADIHILTTTDLAARLATSFKRGVERGRFEEAASRDYVKEREKERRAAVAEARAAETASAVEVERITKESREYQQGLDAACAASAPERLTPTPRPNFCPHCGAGSTSEKATMTCGRYHTSNSCPMRNADAPYAAARVAVVMPSRASWDTPHGYSGHDEDCLDNEEGA